MSKGVVLGSLIILLAAPLGTAAGVVDMAFDALDLGQARVSDAEFSYYCSGNGLGRSSGECSYTYSVPTGYRNLHLRFTFPFLGSGTENINLQQREPVIGFLTFYDRTCSTGPLPYLSSNSVTCFGGQVRDWNAGLEHRFRGTSQITYCVPALCSWEVRATYST